MDLRLPPSPIRIRDSRAASALQTIEGYDLNDLPDYSHCRSPGQETAGMRPRNYILNTWGLVFEQVGGPFLGRRGGAERERAKNGRNSGRAGRQEEQEGRKSRKAGRAGRQEGQEGRKGRKAGRAGRQEGQENGRPRPTTGPRGSFPEFLSSCELLATLQFSQSVTVPRGRRAQENISAEGLGVSPKRIGPRRKAPSTSS